MERILIVDDDQELCELVTEYLGREGFHIEVVHTGKAGLERASSREHALVVLDVMLPELNGFDVLRQLRTTSSVPVLMLTARGDDVDRIVGLEIGADDYLPKPFNPRELSARIRALVRRQRLLGAHGYPADADSTIAFGPFTFNLARRQLERDGDEIALTTAEFLLLQALAQRPNRPLGRDRLIELTRGRDCDMTDRSVDVQVMRLRKLIEEDPARPRYIQTVWCVGYVLVPDGRPRERP